MKECRYQISFGKDHPGVTLRITENGPIRIFLYGDRVLVDGLFRLHDEIGFGLTDSLILCRQKGWIPCVFQFRADAIRAGWSRSKVDAMVKAAEADAASMGLPHSPAISRTVENGTHG